MKYLIPTLFLILFFYTNILTQNSLDIKGKIPDGISIEFGVGNYAVTDEYISKEKYSGSLPFYKIGWANIHESYVYQLGFQYQYSSQIKNYNVSTDIYQFSLSQEFLYSMPQFSLFKKDVHWFLGPSTEMFFYYNNQNIAVSGFDYAQSFAVLFSAGISSEIIYPLSNNLNIESTLKFSALSFAFRMVDEEETDEAPVKLLTLFAGTNASFKLGVRYYLLDNLSIKASYLFNFTRISAWNPLLSASDNIVLTLTYGF